MCEREGQRLSERKCQVVVEVGRTSCAESLKSESEIRGSKSPKCKSHVIGGKS